MNKKEIIAFILKTICIGLVTFAIIQIPEIGSTILMVLTVKAQKDIASGQLCLTIARLILIISMVMVILRFINSINKSSNYFDTENDAKPYFRLALTITGFAIMIKAFTISLLSIEWISMEVTPFYKVVILPFTITKVFKFIFFIATGQAIIWWGKHLLRLFFEKN